MTIKSLDEASGVAASRRNPGILWVHNDGPGGEIYAVAANGRHLATFFLNRNVTDKEDIAVGPGPDSEVSYLYVGDIGGNDGRRQVQILRIPEPFVDSGWFSNPRSLGMNDVNTFTLTYPDGSHDAESLMVDPLSHELFIVTKHSAGARVYRADLTSMANGSTRQLTFASALRFPNISAGDISADGTVIVLRSENVAKVWERSADETVPSALSRVGHRTPVIGPPLEENGEGIALLPNGTGFVTIGEGKTPPIYFFRAQCPAPPQFKITLEDKTAEIGKLITFRVKATGYPQPSLRWSFNGVFIPGNRRNVLILRRPRAEDAGEYSVTAGNRYGEAISTATLRLEGP